MNNKKELVSMPNVGDADQHGAGYACGGTTMGTAQKTLWNGILGGIFGLAKTDGFMICDPSPLPLSFVSPKLSDADIAAIAASVDAIQACSAPILSGADIAEYRRAYGVDCDQEDCQVCMNDCGLAMMLRGSATPQGEKS